MSTTLTTTGITFPDATTQTTAEYCIGIDQTWQDVTANRVEGVTYTNDLNIPIMVSARFSAGNTTVDLRLYVDNMLIQRFYDNPNNSNIRMSVYGIIPAGSTYYISDANVNMTKDAWYELR